MIVSRRELHAKQNFEEERLRKKLYFTVDATVPQNTNGALEY